MIIMSDNVVELGDSDPDSKSWGGVGLEADAVGGLFVQHLPNVYNGISLPPTLQGQELQSLKALPVVKFTHSTDLSGELFLNVLDQLDITNLSRIPQWTTVFHLTSDKGFE